MKVILFVTIIVLGGLSLATWLYLHLEEHMEWREWHVPRGTEFAPCPLEYGEHDGLLLTDVEYATCKDLLEVRYTVENRNKGQTPVRNDLILALKRHRAQDRVPDDLDRDARGSPCANDPIIPAQGPGHTSRDPTGPDLVTADSLPDESIGERPLPPCKK
ncbi:hypothetical protein ACTGNK_09235 [Bifidobacterium longum]